MTTGKHLIWSGTVIAVAFILGFVALTATGHPEQAEFLLSAAVLLGFVAAFLRMFS